MQLVYESDFLQHHGIKGQKWGIRRYQNPDGTLTPLGRNRYGDSNERVGKTKEPSRLERLKAMSDGDLDNAINRLKKEKEYMNLSGDNVYKGKNFAKNIVLMFGTVAVTSFVTTMAKKGGEVAVAAILKKAAPAPVFNAVYKKK